MNLELRVVDRGESVHGGMILLRDVYLRDGNETLLFNTGVPVSTVEKIAAGLGGAALRFEKFAGHPKPKESADGTADRVVEEVAPGKPRCECDAATPCHRVNRPCPAVADPRAPDLGEPVG